MPSAMSSEITEAVENSHNDEKQTFVGSMNFGDSSIYAYHDVQGHTVESIMKEFPNLFCQQQGASMEYQDHSKLFLMHSVKARNNLKTRRQENLALKKYGDLNGVPTLMMNHNQLRNLQYQYRTVQGKNSSQVEIR